MLSFQPKKILDSSQFGKIIDAGRPKLILATKLLEARPKELNALGHLQSRDKSGKDVYALTNNFRPTQKLFGRKITLYNDLISFSYS